MKILFIAEVASIHTARWLNQLKDTGWEVHVFQSNVFGPAICPDLSCGTVYFPKPTKVPDGVTAVWTLSFPQSCPCRSGMITI